MNGKWCESVCDGQMSGSMDLHGDTDAGNLKYERFDAVSALLSNVEKDRRNGWQDVLHALGETFRCHARRGGLGLVALRVLL